RVQVGAETNQRAAAIVSGRDGGKDGNAEIRGEVEDIERAPLSLQVLAHRREERIVKALQIDGRATHAVIPPDGRRVAFDQLQEPTQHRFLERVTGGTAVRIG